MSFSDFQIRVAEYLGVADYSGGAAAVPTDAHDLDLVKRLCNDGWRRFVNAQPKWNWMEPLVSLTLVPCTVGKLGIALNSNPSSPTPVATTNTFTDPARTETDGTWIGATVTIETGTGSGIGQSAVVAASDRYGNFTLVGTWTVIPDDTSTYKLVPLSSQLVDPADNSRYYMPDGFYGQIIGFWTYPVQGPRLKIQNTHENHIRQLYAASGGVTGNPWLAAHRPLPRSVGAYQQRWEVLFYPTPLTAYTISVRVRIYPNKLVNTSDRTAAGFEFDEAVLAAMFAEAEGQRMDKPGPKAQAYIDAISRAIGIDRANSPKRLGYNGDRSDDAYGPGRRPLNYYSVDTYNGNPV